ncbi:MAG: glycosyltransferase [Prevotella sp.]|nr:glycosyltransferase [Prevotella sp.]
MTETNDKKITLSVVMTVHDDAEMLEQNLPLFLTQDLESDCEVIVVDDASTDETPDVLKRMKDLYPQLYTTFLPYCTANPFPKRLALTIGAKAAHNDWVLLADIKRPPLNEHIFQALMNKVDEQQEGVLALYSRKKNKGETRYQWWQEIDEAAPLLTKTERHLDRGHKGSKMKLSRGIYDAVAVRRKEIHDALKYFDQKVSAARLMALRWKVVWRNLLNRAEPLNIQ